MSIKSKIESLITAGNETTGEADTDLTSVVQSLVDGYGGGEIHNQDKTVVPSESAQSITADDGYTGLGEVTVDGIPTNYVGSAVPRKASADLTVNGATVNVPSGYYSASASKSVENGTEGTPTATKGTVANHSVDITPSVTNVEGYISGGTKNGTAVKVSASELVSGTLEIDSSGTKNVTNYESVSVPSGSEGTPTASKGAVSNHSVDVTPSVTNNEGYIEGGTKSGSAVSVSASELVSGTKSISITQNGTTTEDVTNYADAEITVNVPQPSGTKSVSITSNGTTTEDVTNYASASINVNVPNSYSASDEGKVVSNGALVSQSSATYTTNDTYDTTLINEVTVNVSGGGGSDFETGTLTGTGTALGSYITIPVSKQCSHFVIFPASAVDSWASKEVVFVYALPAYYICSDYYSTTRFNAKFDTRSVYVQFSASDIKVLFADNSGYVPLKAIDYKWIAW